MNQSNIESYVFEDSLTDMLRADNYNDAINQVVIRTIGLAGQELQVQPKLASYANTVTAYKK